MLTAYSALSGRPFFPKNCSASTRRRSAASYNARCVGALRARVHARRQFRAPTAARKDGGVFDADLVVDFLVRIGRSFGSADRGLPIVDQKILQMSERVLGLRQGGLVTRQLRSARPPRSAAPRPSPRIRGCPPLFECLPARRPRNPARVRPAAASAARRQRAIRSIARAALRAVILAVQLDARVRRRPRD